MRKAVNEEGKPMGVKGNAICLSNPSTVTAPWSVALTFLGPVSLFSAPSIEILTTAHTNQNSYREIVKKAACRILGGKESHE